MNARDARSDAADGEALAERFRHAAETVVPSATGDLAWQLLMAAGAAASASNTLHLMMLRTQREARALLAAAEQAAAGSSERQLGLGSVPATHLIWSAMRWRAGAEAVMAWCPEPLLDDPTTPFESA